MEDLLKLMLADMQSADKLYRPTNFWNAGMKIILDDLKSDDDFKSFRSQHSARSFYVPTYEHSIYKKCKSQINRIFRKKIGKNMPIPEVEGIFGTLSGYNRAKTDYRIFLGTSSDNLPDLSEVQESLIGEPIESFVFDDKRYSRGFLNYLIGLNFLKNSVTTDGINTILEIGGGYGTLGEIVLQSIPNSFYLDIDIPPVAAVSSYYLTQLLGKENVLTYDQSKDLKVVDIRDLKQKYKCAVLCPWQLPRIKGEFDLFVNFMSFQEMEPEVVENYVKYISPLISKHALLRNSRSGKRKVTSENEVGVIEPTTTDKMIELFALFQVVNRDYTVYGDYSKDYISEIICLSKK